MACLCDEHAMLATDHAPALSECKLDDAGVKAVVLGPGNGVLRGPNLGEINHPSFGLGNDLVLDDQNVALSQRHALSAKRAQQFFCVSCAGSDLIGTGTR